MLDPHQPDFELLERHLDDDLPPEQASAIADAVETHAAWREALDQVRRNRQLQSRLRDASDTQHRHDPPAAPAIPGFDILHELHRGGQGIVYAAHQRSTGRRVALKLLLQGRFASPIQRRRFEREIDLAASLNHPNIVKVFDRAEAPSGEPYYIMELVEGQPLDAYLREHNPPRRRRLALFRKIADAVSYAHQHAVIHRDLKPANILIDQRAEPRILDFGLAKPTDIAATESLATDPDGFVGTLRYAAPEQLQAVPDLADDPRARVDVRTDVYALSVILYEMLTDRLPYPDESPLSALVRSITAAEPIRPRSLAPSLDPDLETILLKGLEKNPDRRYQSASELASDVDRFLRNEPITARPPTAAYQLRKFAQRHKPLVTAAGAIVIAALVGATAVSVSLVRTLAAQRQTRAAMDAARLEAEKQRAIGDFLRTMLASVEPGNAGPDLRVIDLLNDAAPRIETDFAPYPAIRASLHQTLGSTYWRLGALDQAERHLRAAVDLRENPDAPEEASLLAASIASLGAVTHSRGDLEQTESLYQRAADLRREHHLDHGPEWARLLHNLAHLRLSQGQLDDAEELFRRGIRATRSDPDDPAAATARAQLLASYAIVHRRRKDLDKAADLLQRALPVLRENLGEDHPDTIAALSNHAGILRDLGHLDRAEPEMRRLIDLRKEVYGPTHESVAIGLNNLADLLREQRRFDEAAETFDRAIEILTELFGDNHLRTATARHNYGVMLLDRARYAQAEPLLRRAADAAAQLLPEDHWVIAQFRLRHAEALLRLGRLDEARPIISQSLECLTQTFGEDHPRTTKAADLLEELESPTNHTP